MKLLRYGPKGQEKPGLMDAAGVIRDLSAHVSDVGPETVQPSELARLAAIDPATLPEVAAGVRLGVPLTGVRQFIAVGLNYEDHIREAGMEIPSEPAVFTKAVSCLNGPDDDVMLPRSSTKADWEVELGVVIGRRASNVEEASSLEHVAGFVLVNDLSERAFQLERGPTWDKGKGCATFGPVGPWLVTADEVGNFDNLGMWLDLNGERMQTGATSSMIFKVPKLVSYISEFMTLLPGDLITTGTPPGVGMGRKPEPTYLKAGDVMRLGIDGLGVQQQRVVPFGPEDR